MHSAAPRLLRLRPAAARASATVRRGVANVGAPRPASLRATALPRMGRAATLPASLGRAA